MSKQEEIIAENLAARVALGTVPSAKEVKIISDHSLVETLKRLTETNISPTNFNSFLHNLHAAEKLKSVTQSMFERDGNVKAAVGIGFDVAAAAIDPSGASALKLAADVTVLLLRAAAEKVENPALKHTISALADAGKLAGVVATLASQSTGIGIISAIGKELAGESAEKLVGTLFAKAVKELPGEIATATPDEIKNTLSTLASEASSKGQFNQAPHDSKGRN